MTEVCEHVDEIRRWNQPAPGAGMSCNSERVGALETLPDLRHGVLRQLKEQARNQHFHGTHHPIIQSFLNPARTGAGATWTK